MEISETLKYKPIENDNTKEIIERMEKMYEHVPTQLLQMDISYTKLNNQLARDEDIHSVLNYNDFSAQKKNVLESITIWDNFGLKLEDVNIIDTYNSVQEGDSVEITDELLDEVYYAHPKFLTLRFQKSTEDLFSGFLHSFSFQTDIGNGPQTCTIFNDIVISRLNNKLSPCLYNHEITHTQYSSITGSILDILNIETIPIFIEELFASQYNIQTLKLMRYFRLYYLGYYLNGCAYDQCTYADRVEYEKYIKSTLQGIKLINTYLAGNSLVQKEMIDYINLTFSEKRYVEELIAHFDCTLESVNKDLSELKKIYIK